MPDPAASRRHTRIWRVGDRPWIADAGSSAGTWIDGRPVRDDTPVSDGQQVRVGSVLLSFRIHAEPPLLSGDLTRDRSNLHGLLGALARLQEVGNLDEVFQTAVDRAIALVAGDRGALLFAVAGTSEVVVARNREGRALDVDDSWPRTLPRRAIQSERAQVISDAHEEPGALPLSVVAQALRSVVCVPIPGGRGPLGALYVDRRDGTLDLGPAELAVLEALAAQVGVAIDRARVREQVERQEQELLGRIRGENAALLGRLGLDVPLGESDAFRRTLGTLRRVAHSGETISLLGETGTGKEVLARWIHAISGRDPFVVVDCGALPEQLIESELFGHEKGAFTGAVGARIGRFREADGGTIFLDEIGELPKNLQPRLLRVLQDQTVQPVGGTGRVPVDVRVVCATHRNLADLVERGEFREDLYYRLSVVAVSVPPLREREDDILLLARAFLADLGGTARELSFAAEAEAALRAHDWPGNVRELGNRVRRAVLLAEPPAITAVDLGLRPASPERSAPVAVADPPQAPPEGDLEPLGTAREAAKLAFERAYLERLLRQTGGQVGVAAQRAGISRQMLHRLLTRHGLDRRDFREGD